MRRQKSTLRTNRVTAEQHDTLTSDNKVADDLIGQVVDGYEVEALFDTSFPGYTKGHLYRGIDKELLRSVLIRVVATKSENWTAGHETLTAIKQRAQRIAALRHRNISILLRFGISGDRAFSIREFVAGGSLRQRMESGVSFSAAQALDIVIRK